MRAGTNLCLGATSDGSSGKAQCACNPPENCWFQGTECYGMVVDKDKGECNDDCTKCKPLKTGFTE